MPMDVSVDKSAIRNLIDEVGTTAFKRLAGIFVEECDRNCAEAIRFLSENDLSGAEIVGHRFKSTARQFGAFGLAEVCQELEHACAGGRQQRAGEILNALIADLPQVRDSLNKATASALKEG